MGPVRLRDTEPGPTQGGRQRHRQRLGQRKRETQRPRETDRGVLRQQQKQPQQRPLHGRKPSLDSFVVILPATLRGREAGKAEHPCFTDWETEVQKGEVTCPRSHSKSGLLTPSLVHFPHRDRGQRPGETETRGRETWRTGGMERKRKKKRDSDSESMITATAHLATGTNTSSLWPPATKP